uniref:LexA repressor n=1 Tax=uncultured Chloroflexota bacterium TaxID=166587 RepID=H5SAM3_9CHLR|nr:SOS-response transcriptional repressor, LexA [uncultured Chloroflexota bacterium]
MMARKPRGITEKHQKILKFLQEYYQQHHYPPSIREIGEHLGVSSTSQINYYLDQLEQHGLIERDRGISRGVRLARPPSELVRIPILGPIAAGLPLLVPAPGETYLTDDESYAVEIARSMLPVSDETPLFALEVKGDSMIDAMIHDGDIVVLRPAMEAHNGEMVAIWLPAREETTLKYFYKDREGYLLKPANPSMQPIRIPKSEPLEIKGKVVMVVRRVNAMAV